MQDNPFRPNIVSSQDSNIVRVSGLGHITAEFEWTCVVCKSITSDWSARCGTCNATNSIRKEILDDEKVRHGATPITKVDTEEVNHIPTGIGELDRALGGGIVLGGVTLLTGDPGVGKSTLTVQMLASLSKTGRRTLYATAEEGKAQVAARAKRLNAMSDKLYLLAETKLDVILETIDKVNPECLVLDSIQTIRTSEGTPGSVNQLKEIADRVVQRAKNKKANGGIATFIIGHITKDGGIAGPKALEHLVDTVLQFEGEKGQAFRTLHTSKNRNGKSPESGFFEMTANGMEEVPNASEFFLAERNTDEPGSIIAAASEGERSILVEVQAIVGSIKPNGGRITSNGVNEKRVSMIMAILERRNLDSKLQFGSRDIFLNIAGGITITEPALDLPIAIAIMSSLTSKVVPPDTVAFGELGLTGEVRGVPRSSTRITESRIMKFQQIIVPRSTSIESVETKRKITDLWPVASISEVLDTTFSRTDVRKGTSERKRRRG